MPGMMLRVPVSPPLSLSLSHSFVNTSMIVIFVLYIRFSVLFQANRGNGGSSANDEHRSIGECYETTILLLFRVFYDLWIVRAGRLRSENLRSKF